MKSVRVLIAITLVAALTVSTGCVGPMACGHMGACDSCDSCSGCGELYIDPWINHPADVCDPCDCCGNYNGQKCGKCGPVFGGVASLWGYTQAGCGCGESACSSCAGEASCGLEPACDCSGPCSCEPACGLEPGCGFEATCGVEGSYGGVNHEGGSPGCATCNSGAHGAINYSNGFDDVHPSVTEQRGIVSRPSSPSGYQPQHTRKIFTPRGSVPAQPASTRVPRQSSASR
jgi:hypothetical protein